MSHATHDFLFTQPHSNCTFIFQANMHAAFSYDRRDPYARLPLESHVSSANDPSTTSITSVNNVSDHVSRHFEFNLRRHFEFNSRRRFESGQPIMMVTSF